MRFYLASNTRLSNIFREFSKGSNAEGEPAAILISWAQSGSSGHMWSAPVASSRAPGTEAAAAAEGGDSQERTSQLRQCTASIVHLTTRELHTFLFGPNDSHRSTTTGGYPTAGVKVDFGGKRRRTESLENIEMPFQDNTGGAIAFHDALTAQRLLPERSDAAAQAAWGAGGGWCLLQKFIGPTGSRNSTIR